MFHICIFPGQKNVNRFLLNPEIIGSLLWIYQSDRRPAILIYQSEVNPLINLPQGQIEEICYHAAKEGGEHHLIEKNWKETAKEDNWINAYTKGN